MVAAFVRISVPAAVSSSSSACSFPPLSPSVSSSLSFRTPCHHSHLSFLVSLFPSTLRLRTSFNCVRAQLNTLKFALQMDSQPPEQDGGLLPELLTEFMVDMKCDGRVSAVKNKLQNLEAAVAEFKGPIIYGVVRLTQVNMELARIEASFSGLSPGKHGWAINEFGDLTKGASSTGKVFNPENQATSEKPLGDLETLEFNDNGETHFSGAKQMLRVADLIGRSIVVYENEDKSDPGLAAAVVARSAGVDENYKICTCDGVTIWEAN